VQPECASKPPANERADNPNDDVNDDSEPASINDSPRQRASDSTDNQPKDDSVRNVFHAVLRNKNTFNER
jgi:hypothetical protein